MSNPLHLRIERALAAVARRFRLQVVDRVDQGNYAAVLYRNDSTGLRVAVDWSELRPFVTLYELVAGRFPDEDSPPSSQLTRRLAFDADDLLSVRPPKVSPVGKMLGARDLDAAERLVAEYASALEQSAADVFAGDFGVFDQLDENVRRREHDLR